MVQYIGNGLHKSQSFVTRLNLHGRLMEQVALAHPSGAFVQYLRRLPQESRIGVEATGDWM
ncbi:MAG: hypothetical protein R3351_01895 [Nitrospirales bacterium]|nr:hypothetical protein [Nitrospirales bacterium]